MQEKKSYPSLPILTRENLEQLSKTQLIDIVLLLQEQNQILQEKVRKLEARIEELERRLGMNSSNSSMPPSSDSPEAKNQQSRKAPTGRKPGGQPGHEGSHRSLVPADQVDNLRHNKPTKCVRCGALLPDCIDLNPKRHQWVEIPEIKPTVNEIQDHAIECQRCGTVNRVSLPPGIPTGAFGPRLTAFIGVLSGAYRMSKRRIVRLLEDMVHLPISLGSISACDDVVSEALSGPVADAREYVQHASSLYADETGWYQKNQRAWLWAAATVAVTVFLIRFRRCTAVAQELLGNFVGTLVTDRWGAYNYYQGLRQLCWAHLLRAFIGFSELSGEAGKIGGLLESKTNLMFTWWHKIRDGTMCREEFQKKMIGHQKEVIELLIDGLECGHSKMAGVCLNLLKSEKHLWTFVNVEGVEPTNNTAERAVRQGVMWRKTSFGTQSEKGSRFVERVLTATETCRQQNRNVLEYVTAACEARLHNKQAPSLLPA